MPLLRGLDGTRKMSKSYGNHSPVTDSSLDMFGKTMSIPDALLDEWYGLVTDVPQAEYRELILSSPMEAKKRLGCLVGEKFHSRNAMVAARAQWEAAFGAREFSAVDVAIPASELMEGAIAAWRLVWLAHEAARTTAPPLSNSDARRLVKEGAFEFDGKKITDEKAQVTLRSGATFKAGRYRDGERIRQPLLVRPVLSQT
jgi:tyrosyl-tRNA synthetase